MTKSLVEHHLNFQLIQSVKGGESGYVKPNGIVSKLSKTITITAIVVAAVIAGNTVYCPGYGISTLASLKTVSVPEPDNLGDFIKDKVAAIKLGKALFWDMQVGSDGKTSCATCHFHAGADNESKNQISPGLMQINADGTENPDTVLSGSREPSSSQKIFPFTSCQIQMIRQQLCLTGMISPPLKELSILSLLM
ncbi:MAG: cytochrome c peroxidase [Nostoc sp.]